MTTNTVNTVETNPKVQADASVIWMHGLGASGEDFLSITDQFGLPQNHTVRFIFPNAPIKAVTVNNGLKMRAWYDIKCFNTLAFNPNSSDNHEGILESHTIINYLINLEIKKGIDSKRIILAGFSQGGVMALHTGLRCEHQLGGIVCLSGYLSESNLLPKQKSYVNNNTPIFIAHGLFDPIVPFHLGKQSYDILTSLNYTINWYSYPMQHTIIEEEIIDLGNFFKKILKY